MSITVIACGVFRTDLQSLFSAVDTEIDIRYLEGGLHSEPYRLRESLQQAIDEADHAERIILLYGLCGTGTVGIHAGSVPVVVPRVHDCISLFLGSDQAYARQFRETPGTYYISAGWYEEQIQPRGSRRENPSTDPIRLSHADPALEELADRYGHENAEAILHFTHSWKRNYSRAVFIDTGSGDQEKYRAYVEAMGNEFGWRTENLKGSNRLLLKALEAVASDNEILVIQPGQESWYDSAAGRLEAGDPLEKDHRYSTKRRSRIIPGSVASVPSRRIGLGIDAGGTYTDAVLFDFQTSQVLAKSKALTTPWEYTEGIAAALAGLPAEIAEQSDLISVSTTLATNAIVEDNRQAVGLMLMPLGGSLPAGIDHQPLRTVSGRMSIAGEIIEEPDEEEIRAAAREMVSRHGVRAFAVSGYGGTVNPIHEKLVAAFIHDETGLMVCAGHELSGQLDFTVRAATAVLNAGIIPHLETFFHAVEGCLGERGIQAPVLFVRGDGFLMNSTFAMHHPIETALSGPAASIAGARFLTSLEEATVIDVGGTTSDIGYISDGAVESNPDGAMIGTHRTHVRAVDMTTLGLGGDSEIRFDRGRISIGPRRVTPLCRLMPEERGLIESPAYQLDDLSSTSEPAIIFRTTGKKPSFAPDRLENKVLELLEAGPLPRISLARRAGLGHWRFLNLKRLLSVRCIEAVGLTPTDLLHCDGRLLLGDPAASRLGLQLQAALAGVDTDEYSRRCWRIIAEEMSRGVLAKLLDLETNDPAVGLLIAGGSSKAAVSVEPRAPLIGLGAAAPFLLDRIRETIGRNVQIPEHADVANALGAITSNVHAVASGAVLPAEEHGFRLTGIDGTVYSSLTEAEAALEEQLLVDVRSRAEAAGTSEKSVSLSTWDRLAESAGGGVILLERRMEAEVRGIPDLT